MTWLKILPTALSIILTILKWAQERQLLKAGEDQAVAKAALEILETTRAGKELREKIRTLPDDTSDKLWDDMINA